jgi:formiminoglutamate deiminase
MPVTEWFASMAMLPDGAARNVAITVEGTRIRDVAAGVAAPPGARRLPGLVLPGLANAHSHAFHRALRGGGERHGGDFWGWREHMYDVAGRLDPDRYHRLARAVYAEMALAGVTAVGEFHYLHHDAGGRAYADPNAMGEALCAAAADAGIRITLLDACYLRGGFDRPLEGVQLRFGDGDAEAWASRVARRRPQDHVRLGAAIHSVRAVGADAMEAVAGWASEHDAPLHAHVSEQPRENEDCLARTGATPTALLEGAGALQAAFTAVHVTHPTDADVAALGSHRAHVCLCPTTERSLADGIGPGSRLAAAGARLCVGSDSHAVVDLFEEARAVELDERLATGRRGHHEPAALLDAATAGGMSALGWPAGRLEAGNLADFVAVDVTSPRMAGFRVEDAAAHTVYAAGACDVTDVVVSGRKIVDNRRHLLVGDVGAALSETISEVTEG